MERLGEEKFRELFLIGVKRAGSIVSELGTAVNGSVAVTELLQKELGSAVTLHKMSDEERSEALASVVAGICTSLISTMLKHHADATTPQEADSIFLRIIEAANAGLEPHKVSISARVLRRTE